MICNFWKRDDDEMKGMQKKVKALDRSHFSSLANAFRMSIFVRNIFFEDHQREKNIFFFGWIYKCEDDGMRESR